MANLHEVVSYCDARTRRGDFKDAPGAFNGLQFGNDGRVSKVGAVVDSGVVPFLDAVEAGVDFLIAHHGMFWGNPLPITGAVYDKVALLVHANCALYSSHLPLDAHPEIGNNALLARQLGLEPCRPFFVQDGESIGWVAEYGGSRAGLAGRLRRFYPRMIAIEHGSREPLAVAFCSGGGNGALPALAEAGVDTLVTGELSEWTFTLAQEQRLNLYACGHYATEVHGVRALAAEVAGKFGLPWVFIGSENPL